MQQKSKIYSFSANGEDAIWMDGLKDRLQGKSFSKAMLDSAKLKFETKGKTKGELLFVKTCSELGLDAETMLYGYAVSLNTANELKKQRASVEGMDILSVARREKDGTN